ncbi:MAG: HAMP domain-containing protein [Comamonadaceae bacterium]|jgi:methyl-accepting chemotaxis protein|nr:HAMP domain-containing protein [Comamonadaceae bacterium]
MFFLSNLRIARRLALAFGICVALLCVVSMLSATSLSTINESLRLITADRFVKVQLVGQVKDEVNLQARIARNLLIFDQPQDRTRELQQMEASRAKTAPILRQLDDMIDKSGAGHQKLGEVLRTRDLFASELEQLLKLVRDERMGEARSHLMERMRLAQLDYLKMLDQLAGHQGELMNLAAREADELVRSSRLEVLVLTVLAVLAAATFAWWVARSITRPLQASVRLAEAVAQGDLGSRISASTRDETGQLMSALGRMNAQLVDIVRQVRDSSESIATGTGQLATGNADLSQRTEEQASNLEETAATMEQLTATVKQNAETARTATQTASGAMDVATRGGEVVGQVVQTMDRISEASHRIADIIGVIDGIAFQTNILALNAAVEAARAGEQGRGFAVVASEVRALAQRSAEAAKEIKSLINASVETVEAGGQLVQDAGRTMDDVVQQVRQVHTLIGEISAASLEQSSGISQVGDAVMQLDQVTQQNAALVEEAASAADSLQQQAQRLNELVATFKL